MHGERNSGCLEAAWFFSCPLARRPAGFSRDHGRGIFYFGFELGQWRAALLAAARAKLGVEDQLRDGLADGDFRSSIVPRRAPGALTLPPFK